MGYLDYINKKLNEKEDIKLTIKRNVIEKPIEHFVVKKKPIIKEDRFIAKDILFGLDEEISPYSSNLFVKDSVNQNSTYQDEQGNVVNFNKSISSDMKTASMLLSMED